MKAKKHYENYWKGKESLDNFFSYERNSVLPRFFENSRKILDVGCGDGAVSEYILKVLKKDVVGVDLSEDAVKKIKKRGVKAIVVDVEQEKFPFKSREFDTVFWGDNMEHLFDPQATLKEIARVLGKNGRLVFSCPNMGYWRYRIYYLMNGRLPDTEWTGNPPWAWSHIRFFNLKIIEDFLKSQNLEVVRVSGVNKRPVDSFLGKFVPSLFGMIFVIEARVNAK